MKPDSLSRQAKGSASVHPLLSVSSQWISLVLLLFLGDGPFETSKNLSDRWCWDDQDT
jgi:hypothetical protein